MPSLKKAIAVPSITCRKRNDEFTGHSQKTEGIEIS